MIACPVCGAEAPHGARFCARCGAELDASVEARPNPALLRKVCAGCGTVNDFSFSYCYHCGLSLPEAVPLAQAAGNPAGFWIRVAAFSIDGLLLLLGAVGIGVVRGMELERLTDEKVSIVLLAISLSLPYFTIPVWAWGRTPGKLLLGLRIVRSDGSKVSYLRALARYLASVLTLGIGFIAIALSPRKRAWHDLLCATRVVRRQS